MLKLNTKNSLGLLKFTLKDHDHRLPLSFCPCDSVILSVMFHVHCDNISNMLTRLPFCHVLPSQQIVLGEMAPRKCKTWQQLKHSLMFEKGAIFATKAHFNIPHPEKCQNLWFPIKWKGLYAISLYFLLNIYIFKCLFTIFSFHI